MNEDPNEDNQVERPFIEQLKGLGWSFLAGDKSLPAVTERKTFREVLLKDRLRSAIRKINADDAGDSWVDDAAINRAILELESIGKSGGELMEINEATTKLLWTGTATEGPDGGRGKPVHFIDYDHPENNDFLVVNQFRVDPPHAIDGHGHIIPDLVLFVNGIPLVVIECKSPKLTDPMDQAVTQLLRYSGQREEIDGLEGAPRLFHTNQILVAASVFRARAGTICAKGKHFLAWRDTVPRSMDDVAKELRVKKLSEQQQLIAGMLPPTHVIDLLRNFTAFEVIGGKKVKIVARYQQFRAVRKAVERLQTGAPRDPESPKPDGRSGVIWHTQGSGKSLTMVFLVRKMRTLPDLRAFKVVMVTDRTSLQKQLSGTAELTGETVRVAESIKDVKRILVEPGPDLVFAMLQKYQEREEDGDVEVLTFDRARAMSLADAPPGDGDYANARVLKQKTQTTRFPVLNRSEKILILVDEAHRGHAGEMLHAGLMDALPMAAKIGFTGTPILKKDKQETKRIFGDFIDIYSIKQSQDDGTTLKILYELREVGAAVAKGETLDSLFDHTFRDRSAEEQEKIKKRFATKASVLEAEALIRVKAMDMLCHYIDTALGNGFKAQVVGVSRRAAVRYQGALSAARDQIVQELQAFDPHASVLTGEKRAFVERNRHLVSEIARLEFAAVISAGKDKNPDWKEWTDPTKSDTNTERFKQSLSKDPLAILCVVSKLLTGFDAPVEQVLYLDRPIDGADLLQAIARVNRTYLPTKTHGLVVDYCGVGEKLKASLGMYSRQNEDEGAFEPKDVEGALDKIEDEFAVLADRRDAAVDVFTSRDVLITNLYDAVDLLRDLAIRADFLVKLRGLLDSYDTLRRYPKAREFERDVKTLGFIAKCAASLYWDGELNLAGVGHKVLKLIDDHIEATDPTVKLPPVSILADDFEERVEKHTSKRAQASAMEHAVRHEITINFPKDPAFYKKLSEQLEDVISRLGENIEEVKKKLGSLVATAKKGPPSAGLGLSAVESAYYGILKEESSADGLIPEGGKEELARITRSLLDTIRKAIHVVDYWKKSQKPLLAELAEALDDAGIVAMERCPSVASRLVDLARARHSDLVD